MNPFSTRARAAEYAADLADLHGEPMHVFRVPEHSAAYGMGFRYATFRDSERADYEAGGAVVLQTARPGDPRPEDTE